MITGTEFVIRLLLAFILGAGIGIERQWPKARIAMRINIIASLGAAIFVMMSVLVSGEGSVVKTIAPIVLGMSLISASIILQRKGDLTGIFTGITLWCSAGIGALIGSGFFFPAYASTVAIVLTNLIFQPIEQSKTAEKIQNKRIRTSKSKRPQKLVYSPIKKILYRCQVICCIEDEPEILSLLVQSVREKKLVLIAVCSKNINNQDRQFQDTTEIQADFLAESHKEKLELEQAVSVLKSKTTINSVSWQYLNE